MMNNHSKRKEYHPAKKIPEMTSTRCKYLFHTHEKILAYFPVLCKFLPCFSSFFLYSYGYMSLGGFLFDAILFDSFLPSLRKILFFCIYRGIFSSVCLDIFYGFSDR